MFDDFYDAISMLWSWGWPTSVGEVTAVDIERIKHGRGGDTLRLAIAYKFSTGDDRPYTGESFGEPSLCRNRRVIAARHIVRLRQTVTVRYRRDDPSVNRLDRRVWKGW